MKRDCGEGLPAGQLLDLRSSISQHVGRHVGCRTFEAMGDDRKLTSVPSQCGFLQVRNIFLKPGLELRQDPVGKIVVAHAPGQQLLSVENGHRGSVHFVVHFSNLADVRKNLG
jgi:hypothetical protein